MRSRPAEPGPTLGIDIGGTAVKAAYHQTDGIKVAMSSEYARPDRQQLAAAVRQAVIGLGPVNPISVGLCVPGKRSGDGESIELAVNVPGLVGYRFNHLLEDAGVTACSATVVSDAVAATIDVAAESGAERVLGIALGTGVGMALIEAGRPLSIGKGSIGHLGQIDVGPCSSETVFGPDGGRNSLEGYLGVPALRSRLGPDFAQRLGGLPGDDPAIVALSRAIRICLAIYEPDRVVLLGGLGLAMRPLEERIRHSVCDGLTSVAPPGWTLGFGIDRFHAARGACRLARIAAGQEP
jgi:predicted NBD/HSP70 family sugar kinase